jgi:hypothetical protein
MGQTRRGAGMIQLCRVKGQTRICDPRDLSTFRQGNGSDPGQQKSPPPIDFIIAELAEAQN